MGRKEVLHFLPNVGPRPNEVVEDLLRLPPQASIRIVPFIRNPQGKALKQGMITKVTGHEGLFTGKVPHLVRRRPIGADVRFDTLRYSRGWIVWIQGLEVVFPNRVCSAVAVGCPIACTVPKVGDGNAVLSDGPRDVRDNLLYEREQPHVPLTDDVKAGA
jgi:hypothetical protein